MQNVGLQTVLQLSNAAERVQNVAQQQGALTAEQFKEIMDKQADDKKEVVQATEPKDDIKVRDEDRRRRERERREAAGKEAGEAEGKKAEERLPLGPEDQGRLLNIKV
ncbi:MAG: hypothetical protein ACE5EN_02720 [Nitrospinota bacterium]